MKVKELATLLSLAEHDEEVVLVACPVNLDAARFSGGLMPCPPVAVFGGLGELHVACEHTAHRYPDESRVIDHVERAAREIAEAGHLPLGQARELVQQAVVEFGLSTDEPIHWDKGPTLHPVSPGEEAGSNVPE